MTIALWKLGSCEVGCTSPTPACEHPDFSSLSTVTTEHGVKPRCISLPHRWGLIHRNTCGGTLSLLGAETTPCAPWALAKARPSA